VAAGAAHANPAFADANPDGASRFDADPDADIRTGPARPATDGTDIDNHTHSIDADSHAQCTNADSYARCTDADRHTRCTDASSPGAAIAAIATRGIA
jgi:hypothetical protein